VPPKGHAVQRPLRLRLGTADNRQQPLPNRVSHPVFHFRAKEFAVDIVIVNRCTVLSDKAAAAPIPALQAQVTEDWLPHWPGRGATLHFVGLREAVPAGTAFIDLLDTTDVPGAGGYHDLSGKVPYGKVFVADAMQYGEAWTVDLSHELLEMLGDPDVNTILPIPHTSWHCYREVCDAVEADQYGYTKPRWPDVLLSDFCYPAYFKGGPGPYDAMRHLSGPAPRLLSGGYLGIELPDGQWTQIVKRRADGMLSRRAQRIGRTARRLAA
jgi:hypothetical protein